MLTNRSYGYKLKKLQYRRYDKVRGVYIEKCFLKKR